MTSVSDAFLALRDRAETGLVAYVTAGDPDPGRSASVVEAVARAGADVLELGVPFSDPLADGPVIQAAADRARAAGMNLGGTLDLIERVRPRVSIPCVVFTYLNPILRYGLPRFVARAADVGASGVLVLDLPVEECQPLRDEIVRREMDYICLVSPTSSDTRLRLASSRGTGFVYVISRLGVTGARASVASTLAAQVARVRATTTLPLAVGFGVSEPDHVREIGRCADAVVVGSALVDVIARHAASADLEARVASFVSDLKAACRGGSEQRHV